MAHEVKALASQTTQATQQISEQIGEIQSSTAESATAIDAIADTIKRMNEIASKIAVSVADPAGPPLDPFGGRADIKARLLRAVSARSFEDDPLRVLRAARLGAELGFELDPGTPA